MHQSDGKGTWTSWLIKNNGAWEPAQSVERAVAGMTGVAARAPTTIPAALMHLNWGYPFTMTGGAAVAGHEKIGNSICYTEGVFRRSQAHEEGKRMLGRINIVRRAVALSTSVLLTVLLWTPAGADSSNKKRQQKGAAIGGAAGLATGKGVRGAAKGAAVGAGVGAATAKGKSGKNARKGGTKGAAVGAGVGLVTGGAKGAVKGGVYGGAAGAVVGGRKK